MLIKLVILLGDAQRPTHGYLGTIFEIGTIQKNGTQILIRELRWDARFLGRTLEELKLRGKQSNRSQLTGTYIHIQLLLIEYMGKGLLCRVPQITLCFHTEGFNYHKMIKCPMLSTMGLLESLRIIRIYSSM